MDWFEQGYSYLPSLKCAFHIKGVGSVNRSGIGSALHTNDQSYVTTLGLAPV